MSPRPGPPMIREPPPIVTALTGDEPQVDAPTLAIVAWSIRRYSSFTYLQRVSELLRGLIGGLDAKDGQRLIMHRSRLKQGLDSFRLGEKTPAYAAVQSAMSFRSALVDARDERGPSLRDLRTRLGASPVVVAAERACAMAVRIQHTLSARWAHENILADRPSLHLRPPHIPAALPLLPPPDTGALEIDTAQEVPQTGIWMPTTIRHACPNLLIAGRPAPPLTRASERIDYAAWPGSSQGPPRPAWTDYELRDDEPTTWRLAWIDERYRDGLIVPEPEYLDDDNAIPEGLA